MNKNIFTILFAISLISSVIAQDSKKFRFGLKATPSLNWYRPDDTKIKGNGAGLGFGWGLITEFSLTDNVSLATGLQVDYDHGKLSYAPGDTSNYFKAGANYVYLDPNVVLTKNLAKDTVGKTFEVYNLNEREYKVNYVTIPLVLKMKTKEIGVLTYFGQFGFNVSVKTKAIANDKGISYNTTKPFEKSKIDISSDPGLFRLQLSVGGGTEWNLSGSTSLVFSLNYNRGFTNVFGVFSNKSDHLYMEDKTHTVVPFTQKAFADNVALTVGILF